MSDTYASPHESRSEPRESHPERVKASFASLVASAPWNEDGQRPFEFSRSFVTADQVRAVYDHVSGIAPIGWERAIDGFEPGHAFRFRTWAYSWASCGDLDEAIASLCFDSIRRMVVNSDAFRHHGPAGLIWRRLPEVKHYPAVVNPFSVPCFLPEKLEGESLDMAPVTPSSFTVSCRLAFVQHGEASLPSAADLIHDIDELEPNATTPRGAMASRASVALWKAGYAIGGSLELGSMTASKDGVKYPLTDELIEDWTHLNADDFVKEFERSAKEYDS